MKGHRLSVLVEWLGSVGRNRLILQGTLIPLNYDMYVRMMNAIDRIATLQVVSIYSTKSVISQLRGDHG